MRRLTYLIAVTLDGFIAGPDRGDPTGPDGFWPLPGDYIQHLVAEFPETLPAAARTALGVTATGGSFDTALMGRRTYEIGLDAGVTNAYPHLRNLVFSRTLTGSPDPSVEVVAGDPVTSSVRRGPRGRPAGTPASRRPGTPSRPCRRRSAGCCRAR